MSETVIFGQDLIGGPEAEYLTAQGVALPTQEEFAHEINNALDEPGMAINGLGWAVFAAQVSWLKSHWPYQPRVVPAPPVPNPS